MTPTHESLFDSIDVIAFRCARRMLARFGVLCLAGMLFSGLAVEAGFAAPSSGEPIEALRGPWRWLVPDLDGLRPTPRLAVGPWREVAVTRDPDRRQLALIQLERDIEVDQSEATRFVAKAAILRRAALESARLLEAAGESVAAAEAYAGVVASRDVALIEIWHGLAANLARAGDAAGAERAFPRGLDASGRVVMGAG